VRVATIFELLCITKCINRLFFIILKLVYFNNAALPSERTNPKVCSGIHRLMQSLQLRRDCDSTVARLACDRATRGIDPLGWRVWPLKIWKRGQSMFWPRKNVTFFRSKLLLDNSASFTSSSTKDLCQKWKVKLFFPGAYRLSGTGIVEYVWKPLTWGVIWNSLMACPDWPWPPYFTTESLRHCACDFRA